LRSRAPARIALAPPHPGGFIGEEISTNSADGEPGGEGARHAPRHGVRPCQRQRGAVGDKLTIMLDSGVRRGADILIAWCLGAQFVFFGRPTLYGAVVGGAPGIKKAIDIFRNEIDLVMAQIPEPRPARTRFPVARRPDAEPLTGRPGSNGRPRDAV